MKTQILSVSDCTYNGEDSVLAYGHFDSIHPGHIRYIQHAKTLGKKLYIALIDDEHNIDGLKLKFSKEERSASLALFNIADYIVLLKQNNIDYIIECLKPKFFVIGSNNEREPKIVKSKKMIANYGGKIEIHAGDVTYATTDLLKYEVNELKEKRIIDYVEACKKQNINKRSIVKKISDWPSTRLLVIGDVIVDQYSACEPLGISAEAPVIVVRELETKSFLGAAGVVAAHITGMGAKCDLISVVGDDENADLVRKKLDSHNIGEHLIIDKSRPTTFKKRYIVENQKLFRVSRLEQHVISSEIEEKVIDKIHKIAPKVGGIVVSDFVYGVITSNILRILRQYSEEYGIPLYGDVQCSSQAGDISRFNNFKLLTPNEKELRYSFQNDNYSGIEELSRKLISRTGCENLIVKLAANGFIVYSKDSLNDISSQYFPALNTNPVDVTGAGDSMLAVLAIGLTSGLSMMESSAIAACIASLAVGRMGNSPASVEELRSLLEAVI